MAICWMSDQKRKKNPPSSSSSENHPERDWTVSPLTRNKNRGDNCCWTRGSFLLSVQFNHSYSAHVQETERVRTTKSTWTLSLNWSWAVGGKRIPSDDVPITVSQFKFIQWVASGMGQRDKWANRQTAQLGKGEGRIGTPILSKSLVDRIGGICRPRFLQMPRPSALSLPRCFFQLISAFH